MKKQMSLIVAAMTLTSLAHGLELSQIRPFNVASQVLSFRVSGSGLYLPAVISNSEAAASYMKGHVQITNIEIGRPWEGENSNVRIKSPLIGRCLTVTGSSALGMGLEWMPCVQKSAATAFKRQTFFLRTNGHRASALETLIQEDLGLPGAVRKCVERVTPRQVALRDCSGVGSWSISH